MADVAAVFPAAELRGRTAMATAAAAPSPPDRVRPARADPHGELRKLVMARGPLRRALAAVAGRLVTARAWERLGFARLRDYAVERAGHSARSIQDLARVDTVLAGLPRVEAALVEGEITWTKARLLCRVANADDETLWVAFAREKTARALSREVRARWWRARQLARRVAGEALPVWGCMEAIAAEVLSALPLDVEVEPAPSAALACVAASSKAWIRATSARPANGCAVEGTASEASPGPSRPANGCAGAAGAEASATLARAANGCAEERAAELPTFLASLVAGLESADAFELDARLRRAVALEQRLEAEMGPLLLRIAEGRLHRAAGFGTMEEYARERLGISPRKARALLRLERAGRRAPLLREAYRNGCLSWVQAHTLLPVLAIARTHQRAWIDWAHTVTVRRLQEDVERALILHETDPTRFEETGGLPAAQGSSDEAATGRSEEHIQNRQTGAKPTHGGETCRIFWNGPREVAQLFRAVLCTVRRHIERRTGTLPSEGEALDALLEHAFEAWTSGIAMGPGIAPGMGEERVRAAHRVFARDGWRCTVPGCSSYRELHDHHIHFRSAGGSEAESNRTTLCAWHHLRGVHAGTARLRLHGRAPRRLRFELGLRHGAPPLLRYDASERLSPAPRLRSSPGHRPS